MKWLYILGIIFVAVLITLYEWPRINKDQIKEKRTFTVLTIGGVLLACLLVFFPDMPGPNDLIDFIFKPIGRLLEQ